MEINNNWKPIETAPHNKRVLVYLPLNSKDGVFVNWQCFTIAELIDNGTTWYSSEHGVHPIHPTHWMELIKPE